MKKKNIILLISFFISIFVIVGGAVLYTNVKYPIAYKDEIIRYSAQYSLDKTLVASLINEESGFNKNAISSKNAQGLMQLSPQTAKFIAGELGEEYVEEKLFDPDTNIKYGCWYLNYLRSKFVDKEVYLSAYNAGETTVRLWLKNKDNSNDGVSLSNIPYPVTRNYVDKIIHGQKLYQGRI